ncbi:MAG: flavin monoamine oxidase family protein [Terriglobales bacterium]
MDSRFTNAPVAVIGAGASGLAALQSLRAAGCDALLIEAHGRIGGRICTLQPQGWPAPVELGAEFLQGAVDGLTVAASPRGRDWSLQDGKLRPAGEFAGGADTVLARLMSARGPDQSFAAWMSSACRDLPPEARAAALGFIEGYEAADPRRISVQSLQREFAADDEAAIARRPQGGYQQLLDRLRPEAASSLWLSAPVRRLAWRPGEVRLTAGDREVRARAAVITLPLAVLQGGDVAFDPPLTAKRDALAGLVMGGALRVVFRLRSRFWARRRDDLGNRLTDLRFLFGSAHASGHFPTWGTDPRAPQITAWAAGRHAWTLAGRAPRLLARRALLDLAERLRLPASAVAAEVLAAYLHDWQSDPFARGAYSYASVGAAGAHAQLAEPLAGTLFFAGEATDATGHHATVAGAVASGRRAAAEVLASL